MQQHLRDSRLQYYNLKTKKYPDNVEKKYKNFVIEDIKCFVNIHFVK